MVLLCDNESCGVGYTDELNATCDILKFIDEAGVADTAVKKVFIGAVSVRVD